MTRTRINHDMPALGLAVVCPRAALPSSGED
jgi:hypothetical protein